MCTCAGLAQPDIPDARRPVVNSSNPVMFALRPDTQKAKPSSENSLILIQRNQALLGGGAAAGSPVLIIELQPSTKTAYPSFIKCLMK